MRIYFLKNSLSNKARKLARRIKQIFSSEISQACFVFILGGLLPIYIYLFIPALLFIFCISKRLLMICILSFGCITTLVFLNNLANISGNPNTHQLVIISKRTDFYEAYSTDSNHIVKIYTKEHFDFFSFVEITGEAKFSNSNPYYLLSTNYYFYIKPNSIQIISGGIPFIFNIRDEINNKFDKNLTQDSANLAKSLIFGDSSFVEEDIKEAFRSIGILHVIALSGYNFILILSLVNYCLFFLDRKSKLFITIPFGITYLIIAGITNLSGLRALIFFIILNIINFYGGKISQSKLILITIAIFILINPFNIFSISLALSYLAYFGIITASKIKGGKAKKLLSEQLLVSTFTLPVVSILTISLNLLSIIINIAISPIVSIISVLLVCSIIIWPLFYICEILIEILLNLVSVLNDNTLMLGTIEFLLLILLAALIANLANIFKFIRSP